MVGTAESSPPFLLSHCPYIIITLQLHSLRPTAFDAMHLYVPASASVAFDITNSTKPSLSNVKIMRRLGRNLTPLRYQVTPTAGYASICADSRSSSPSRTLCSASSEQKNSGAMYARIPLSTTKLQWHDTEPCSLRAVAVYVPKSSSVARIISSVLNWPSLSVT